MREMKTLFVYILTGLLILFCVESKSYKVDAVNFGQTSHTHTSKTQHLNKSLDKSAKRNPSTDNFSIVDTETDFNSELDIDNLIVFANILGISSLLALFFKSILKKEIFSQDFDFYHVKTFILIQSLRI